MLTSESFWEESDRWRILTLCHPRPNMEFRTRGRKLLWYTPHHFPLVKFVTSTLRTPHELSVLQDVKNIIRPPIWRVGEGLNESKARAGSRRHDNSLRPVQCRSASDCLVALARLRDYDLSSCGTRSLNVVDHLKVAMPAAGFFPCITSKSWACVVINEHFGWVHWTIKPRR